MHTIWIVPGRFGLTFGPQQTGSLKKFNLVRVTKMLLRRIWGKMIIWKQRNRQRTHLSHLSDDLLKDIGLSHEARAQEVAKRFWED